MRWTRAPHGGPPRPRARPRARRAGFAGRRRASAARRPRCRGSPTPGLQARGIGRLERAVDETTRTECDEPATRRYPTPPDGEALRPCLRQRQGAAIWVHPHESPLAHDLHGVGTGAREREAAGRLHPGVEPERPPCLVVLETSRAHGRADCHGPAADEPRHEVGVVRPRSSRTPPAEARDCFRGGTSGSGSWNSVETARTVPARPDATRSRARA